MNIQILQENFSKALGVSARFVSSKATLPVLANILLKTKNTRLLLQATNLESSISTSIGAKVQEEGAITVPARFLADLVANLPKTTISLTAKQEQLKIATDNMHANIAGVNPSEFPTVPEALGQTPICIPSEDFLSSLAQTLFAVSTDETRPVLTGILMVWEKDQLVLVGTDGHRLSQKKVKIAHKGEAQKVILPKSVVAEVGRLASGTENVCVDIVGRDNNVLFGFDQTVLTSRIIEGEFPNFERIIPKEKRVTVRVDKEDFLRGVKLASVFARDGGFVGKVKVSEGLLTISSESPRSGDQETSVEARVEGEPLEVMYNLHFVEDFLHVVQGNEVTLELTDSASAGVFKDSADPSFLHLIMPVKLQGLT